MCGGGASEPEVDYSVQRKQAELAQRYDDHYRKYFLPVERELVALARDDSQIALSAGKAGERAHAAWDAGAGQTGRHLARYGLALTDRQQQAGDFKNAFGRATTGMQARGQSREGSLHLQGSLRDNLLSLGRGTQSEGLGLYQQAGQMEAQRNMANQQIAASNHASGLGFMGQLAGTGASLFMMSDKNRKKNIRPRSDGQDMRELKGFANYDYDYKPGMSGGRTESGHTGPMAQEMPPSMSDGRTVDLGDALMISQGAIRDLDSRLRKLEKK